MQIETESSSIDTDTTLVQKIIARYEYEEDEFLRELEDMQTQVSARSSICDDVPVLGALCSLVGEIGELRKENRKLRNRLSVVAEPRRGVVHRVGALLDGRNGLLPKFIAKKTCSPEIRSGARERLSTPPRKDCLTASSYSADISSDFSETKRHVSQHCIPPLVLPEVYDSDVEQSGISNETSKKRCNLSPSHGFRTLSRSSHFSSASDNTHTSPSSASSRDPSETMTSSRSSFLELIGIRRKKGVATNSKNDFITGGKYTFKKRKRIPSETDSFQSMDERRHGNENWTILNVKSRCSIREKLDKVDDAKKTLLQEPKQYRLQRQKRLSRYRNESEDNTSRGYSTQNDSIYTDSTERISSSCTESCVQQRGISQGVLDSGRTKVESRHVNDDAALRKDLALFKSRNNRLIEQLREKSMENSKLSTQVVQLQKQVDAFRNRCRLNEDLEKWTFDDRINMHSLKILETVEVSLQKFEQRLQFIKSGTIKNEEMAVNSTLRDQDACQTCIEQLERLQRENFHLLQLRATEMGFQEKHIRHLLEMMPSYDALYSFTMGIVRKLGQLRATFIEKNIQSTQMEMELMQMRISLLLAHAQMERIKLQNSSNHRRNQQRPISYHGESLQDQMANAQLHFYIPLQLHGSRAEKLRQSNSINVETEVEKNEQNIESEFLRLFDYARCLSHVCDEDDNILQQTGKSSLSLTSHFRSRDDQTFNKQASPSGERTPVSRNSFNRISLRNRKTQSTFTRPVSLVETQDRKTAVSSFLRRYTKEYERKEENRDESSPNLNLNRIRNMSSVKPIVSSLQDVSNPPTFTHSPSSTPHIPRSVCSPGQIQRKSSFDHHGSAHQQHSSVQENSPYELRSSRGTVRSDYGFKVPTTGYPSLDKKRTTSTKLASPCASRLRRPTIGSPVMSHYNRETSMCRINTSSGSLPNCPSTESRMIYQPRHNQDHIAVIHEESPSKVDLSEKSRLPKLASVPIEKKKGSWLSRLTQKRK